MVALNHSKPHWDLVHPVWLSLFGAIVSWGPSVTERLTSDDRRRPLVDDDKERTTQERATPLPRASTSSAARLTFAAQPGALGGDQRSGIGPMITTPHFACSTHSARTVRTVRAEAEFARATNDPSEIAHSSQRPASGGSRAPPAVAAPEYAERPGCHLAL
jgi:hypothetical protein